MLFERLQQSDFRLIRLGRPARPFRKGFKKVAQAFKGGVNPDLHSTSPFRQTETSMLTSKMLEEFDKFSHQKPFSF